MPFATLQGDALAKAVRLNPKYAFETGWVDVFYVVVGVLTLPTPNPSAEDLANAVYGFQLNQSGLKADGILGPNTWARMSSMPISSGGGSMSAPDHIKDTPAADAKKPTAAGRPNSGVWVGLLLNVGAFTGAAGYDYVAGTMYSIDDRNRSFDAVSDRVRIGVGAGVGIGAAVAIMSNLYDRQKLQGERTEGYDFNIAIGPKVSALAKGAVKTSRIFKVLDRFEELRGAGVAGRGLIDGTKAVLRQAARLDAEEYAALVKCARESKAALDAQDSKRPSVSTLSLPLPGPFALELSMFFQQDKWSVEPSTGML